MDWAIYSLDPLTGLIIAATLMHPTKKIKNVDLEFILRRYKAKRFARGGALPRRAERERAQLEPDRHGAVRYGGYAGAARAAALLLLSRADAAAPAVHPGAAKSGECFGGCRHAAIRCSGEPRARRGARSR
jgi:hypothetical protein